jgi:hypothetical protein
VRYGLQIPANETKELPEKVYKAGMTKLMNPLVDYIFVLLGGGRQDSGESEGDTEGNA